MINKGTYHFQIGNFECISIQDGSWTPTVKGFFGHVPQDERHLIPFEDDETLEGSISCLLIKTGTKTILLDAGTGVLTGANGRLPHQLAHISYADMINLT